MLRNATLVAPLVAWTIAQVLKFVIDGISKGRADFRRLVNPGGMPSSHSTLVSYVMMIKDYGWDSPLFAMAAVLSLIVLYDAAGIRRAAGKQAQVINRIVEDIYKKRKVPEQRLKEL